MQYFGICIRRWSFLGSVYNVLKIHGGQRYFDFEFPKIKVPSIKLINDFSGLAFK